jgi:AP-1 complex subunit mu
MAVSAICILDNTGSAICARDYRGDVPLTAMDSFYPVLSDLEETSGATPVLQHNGVTYVWMRHSDVFLVALCQSNANAASTITFLHKLLDVFKFYFKLVIEESIRDNFVTVYELLDEVMDFGYPQFTEGAILREYIKTEAHKLEDFVGGLFGSSVHSKGNKELPSQVTGVGANWRKQGIFYQRNEVRFQHCALRNRLRRPVVEWTF